MDNEYAQILAGFIRAENINGAKVLDGIQILHKGLFIVHGDSDLCQAGGHD